MAQSSIRTRWSTGAGRDRGMMLLGIVLLGVALGSIAIAVNIFITAVTDRAEPSWMLLAVLAVLYLLASVALGAGGRYLLHRGGAGWDRIEELRTSTVAGKLIDGGLALFLCVCAVSAFSAADGWPARILYGAFAALLGWIGLARLTEAVRLRAWSDETDV